MESLKQYLIHNFEGVFVLVILTFVSAIVWLVDSKLPFLNFFYLPVLLSSYYLGIRSGVLGAFFTFLVIVMFAALYPERFMGEIGPFDLWSFIMTWAGFLILTAVIVGFTHRELQDNITEALRAKAEASGNAELLEQTMSTIREFESELDFKVEERTRALQEKTQTISAHKEKVEETLYTTMDPVVAKLVIENRIRTENRRISVMFSDLMGFTQYSEDHSPEVVITELNKYLADMENILVQYKAHIDKYMGDGIMAEFGAPVSLQRHALLAAAAWKMQERMRSANHPFKLRIGISTGIATTGIIGAKRQSFTAFGDTVNLAPRIEALCKPGRVTVDEATVHECSDNFEFRPVTGLTPFADLANAGVTESLNASMMEVEENPNSIGSRIELAQLLVKVEDLEEAMIQFKAAMDLDPDNAEIKIAYADLALQIEQNRNVSVRGRSSTVHLYEIVGPKDPLKNTAQLPPHLLQGLQLRLDKLIPYPEDLVLPVECMDGSVGFSRLIGATAFLIADRMELADQDKHEILEAGYLGQIGKTIVPENVLNRNGGLTEDELTLIHMHPREGVRKLRNVGYDNERMLELIECSHENFDGSGYPAGIKGDNIPLGARILAVAEAYVSLTSKRPYRNPWDGRAAMTELSKYVQTGKFDPAVVEALSQIVAEL